MGYEIPIIMNTPSPLVFAVVRISQAKQVRNNHDDLKTFTTEFKINGLPKGFTVLAESAEVAEFLMRKDVLVLIEALAQSVEMIYLTDIVEYRAPATLMLRGNFLFPSHIRDVDEVTKQLELVLQLIELASNVKLSNSARILAEKERVAFNKGKLKEKQQEREEEILKKKEDKKNKEKEALQGLSKEKQRKMEEKEYKQSLKKSRLKVKMVKG